MTGYASTALSPLQLEYPIGIDFDYGQSGRSKEPPSRRGLVKEHSAPALCGRALLNWQYWRDIGQRGGVVLRLSLGNERLKRTEIRMVAAHDLQSGRQPLGRESG